MQEQTNRLWPQPSPAGWLMLNGAWTLAPERHRETLGRMKTQHVVIADDFRWKAPQIQTLMAGADVPVSLIEIFETGTQRINLAFRPM